MSSQRSYHNRYINKKTRISIYLFINYTILNLKEEKILYLEKLSKT